MYFTDSQKAAIQYCVAKMIVADGRTHPMEEKAYFAIARKLGLTNAILNITRTLSSNQIEDIISNMSYEQKRVLESIMCCIMQIDGNVDVSEIAEFNYFRTVCNLPDMEIYEMQATFRNLMNS